jgi:alkanesulfonate monooxygenase SsuD/methylene tetrahydromethanopterin reductase-like flavin-dependent oxidoreductase (luciferase family)
VEVGLALPQYDYPQAGGSAAAGDRLGWDTVSAWAVRAEQLGFSSLWVADHLVLSAAKYGGSDREYEGLDPLVALGGLAPLTAGVRLGVLVLCAPLRPHTVLAKQLAGLDVLSNGRLVAGLGAGWFRPDFTAAGVPFVPLSRRLAQLEEAFVTVRRVWAGGDGAPPCLPPPVQQPGPPLWTGGRSDRLLEVAARHADGWNTVWAWTIDQYRERVERLHELCDAMGRDRATLTLSVGLYTLVGEDDADLRRRFALLRSQTPPGVLDGVDLDDWRAGRLVGSVEQVRDQVKRWEALGVGHLIVGLGAVPFQGTTLDELELVARACL